MSIVDTLAANGSVASAVISPIGFGNLVTYQSQNGSQPQSGPQPQQPPQQQAPQQNYQDAQNIIDTHNQAAQTYQDMANYHSQALGYNLGAQPWDLGARLQAKVDASQVFPVDGNPNSSYPVSAGTGKFSINVGSDGKVTYGQSQNSQPSVQGPPQSKKRPADQVVNTSDQADQPVSSSDQSQQQPPQKKLIGTKDYFGQGEDATDKMRSGLVALSGGLVTGLGALSKASSLATAALGEGSIVAEGLGAAAAIGAEALMPIALIIPVGIVAVDSISDIVSDLQQHPPNNVGDVIETVGSDIVKNVAKDVSGLVSGIQSFLGLF